VVLHHPRLDPRDTTSHQSRQQPNGDLELWEPLAEWLSEWRRDSDKREMLKDLENTARQQMAENREIIVELLAANGMAPSKSAWLDALCGVEEDGEKHDSLLLGTIPEFTQSAIQAMSGKWAWTEERSVEQLKRSRTR
jgi:hypothetical protein